VGSLFSLELRFERSGFPIQFVSNLAERLQRSLVSDLSRHVSEALSPLTLFRNCLHDLSNVSLAFFRQTEVGSAAVL
jgi:hypothetical protein